MSLGMKATRAFLLAVMVIVPLGVSIGQAGAKPPIGVCPPPFQGPLTYQQVIDEFPPPPGIDPIPFLVFHDKNGDGMLCAMATPHGGNFIDNVAQVP